MALSEAVLASVKPKSGTDAHLLAIVAVSFAFALATFPFRSEVTQLLMTFGLIAAAADERQEPLLPPCAFAMPVVALFTPVMQPCCALLCSWARVAVTPANPPTIRIATKASRAARELFADMLSPRAD